MAPLRRAAAALLAAALLPAARSDLQQGKIYPVDTRQILCDGQPGFVNISGLRAGEMGDPTVPFVLSFFRSDSANVSFSFKLVDAEGTVVVENMTLTLGEDGTDQSIDTSRRLAAGRTLGKQARWQPEERVGVHLRGAVEEGLCEEFFLSDGRNPVELPDTWSEARDAFNQVCLAEGLTESECEKKEKDGFQGFPEDEENEELMEYSAHDALCDKLMRSILEAPTVDMGPGEQVSSLSELKTGDGKPYNLARRLKSGGSSGSSGSSGGAVSNNGFMGTRTGVREVGYSDARRSAAFGGTTPVRTQYGYTGTSAYQRRAVPVAAGLSSSFMFWRMRGGGGGSRGSNSNAGCSADNRFKECEFAGCRPCVSSDKEAAQCKTEPCASCATDEPYLRCLSADCAVGSSCLTYLGDTVIRDDLMTMGFVPDEFYYPFHLIIGNLTGNAFQPQQVSAMCPPSNWAGFQQDSNLDNMPWLFAGSQDIFVQMVEMEEIFWDGGTASGAQDYARSPLLMLLLAAAAMMRGMPN